MYSSNIKFTSKYFTVKRNTTFNIDDYLKEQNEYWFQKIYRKKSKYLKIFKNKILSKNFYDLKNIKHGDDC